MRAFNFGGPVVQTANQESSEGTKKSSRATKAYKLWKLKSSQSTRFQELEKMREERVKELEALPSEFKEVTDSTGRPSPGWFYHEEQKCFLEQRTQRQLWYDERAGIYRELHACLGGAPELSVAGQGAAGMVPAASTLESKAAPRGGTASRTTATASSATKSPAPATGKHIIIPDLHKVAEILKLDLQHIDKPAAMLGVYGNKPEALSADVAARSVHEQVLKRLAAFRSRWSEEALQAVLVEVLAALAFDGKSPAGLVGAVAMILGSKLVVAACNGATVLIADSLPDEMKDARKAVSASDGGIEVACLELDRRSAGCLLLHSGECSPQAARAAAARVEKGKLRAGALVLLQGSPGDAKLPPAAGVLRLNWAEDSDTERPAKRRREGDAAAPSSVRCRHILLKYVGCKQATDPVRKRPVRRSLLDAQALMLQTLADIDASNTPEITFTKLVRDRSECVSSLRGGDLAGDVGWLKLPVVKANERIPKEVQAKITFIRQAMALEIGELSDIIVSDDGVHLLKRIS